MDQEFYAGNSPEDAKIMVKELEELMKHPEKWISFEEVIRELEDLIPPENNSGTGGDHGQ
jgi:hypothetical protein